MFNIKDMFGNLGNLAGMQAQMAAIQKRVAAMKITGEAGAGMVKVTVNGENKVLKIEIDDSLLNKDSKSMLSELIISAANSAQEKSREAMQHEMKGLLGGLGNIPGLDKMLGK